MADASPEDVYKETGCYYDCTYLVRSSSSSNSSNSSIKCSRNSNSSSNDMN